MDFATLRSPLPYPLLLSQNRYRCALDNPPHKCCRGYPLFLFLSPNSRPRDYSAIVVAAGKHDKRGGGLNKKKKDDTHSFIPKPDEATGPFPEVLLLKERKVEEDGVLMPEFADAEERVLFEALNLQLESDMDTERMRHYEVVYLIHEDYKDKVENVNTKVREFLKEKKGKIWRMSDWGMRRLAYKIQKTKNAHYILMNFEVEAKWINDFKSLLDKDERVIRHLVMKKDKAETKDCPPPPDFYSLRAGEDDNEYEDDEDYEDDEEWDEEEEGIIYVEEDGDEDDRVANSSKSNKAKPVSVGKY